MALDGFERRVLAELRRVTGRKKLREKDLLEWSSSQAKVADGLRAGEVMVELPNLAVFAAIPAE